METFFDTYLTLLRFSLECYLATFLYTTALKRRNRFGGRLILSLLCSALIVLALTAIYAATGYALLVQVLCVGIIALPCNIAWMLLSYKEPLQELLFCGMLGLLTQRGATKLLDTARGFAPEFSVMDAVLSGYKPADQLVQLLIVGAIFAAVYFLFGRRYRQSESEPASRRRILILYCITIFLLPVMSNVGAVLRGGEYNLLFILFSFCEACICFLLIAVQMETIAEMEHQSRERTLNGLLAQSQKQYESLKESIEIINIKCHDLKHRIRHLHDDGNEDAALKELEESISIYDSTIQTGNDILDVILTDKSLRCNAAGIPFICIADGEKLGFMAESDLCALFGNAIENAMEYEMQVQNPEKRYIALNVQASEALLYIRVENYFEGTLTLQNGLPVTTKTDSQSHGFGVKSMVRVVEKYGGTLSIKTEDELFKLGIIIPLNA